ncbi:MAG: hypothetical protein R3B40_22285 [Polyangiales bacterium]|nr:hypothetical protein [Myxococcales bacterium]MCB9656814.1 hypothetical protein [Sandaracinaceae bacterium]
MNRLLRSRLLVLSTLGCSALYAGCGEETPNNNADMGMLSTDGGGSDLGGGGSAWTVRTHPCPGINRTDAFHVDTDGTMWLGCGTGAVGDGLYRSDDEGVSWAIPATSPANILTSFRVDSVHRGADGLVYVAGTGSNDARVISLDTNSTPFAAAAVLTAGGTVDTTFTVSPFVTTASGAAFADSLNGHGALYRPNDTVGDDGTLWTEAQDWESDDSGHQILDLVALGERFVGCGSTIAEPPFVYLPSQEPGAELWEMTPVALVSGLGAYTGEMWGVAASDARVVVVGVDQDNDIGKIFVSGTDRYAAADYTQIDIDGLLPTRVSGADSTWARGVCMAGNRVVVVGEIQPLGAGDNSGFVLESTDGGATFTDVTPDGSPDTWSKCVIDGSGRILVAGAGAVALSE